MALDYPTRPVHIIVGFPAATTPDIVARLLGQWLATRLGQPFVIENHPGAGSSIAAQDIVKARADGYTLFMATTSNTINATFYPNLTFNFARDVAPVAIVNGAPFVMVINPALPPKTVPEFIAYAKSNPGRINMASPGVGTTAHLCYVLLKMMTGVDLVHVPYRASYIPDLIGGQVQVAFSTVAPALSYIQAGKLRALAVTSATRVDTLPDVPSLGEFLSGYEAVAWQGVVAPKGTLIEIIDTLNSDINVAVAEAKIKAQLLSLGLLPLSMTPAKFGKLITDDAEKWAKVIRAANLKPE
jgi:tripartite-type tricarboxylate transporter receptor subunit TctC